MAEQKDIFLSTVVPIMDKVRDDLSRKQAAKVLRFQCLLFFTLEVLASFATQ